MLELLRSNTWIIIVSSTLKQGIYYSGRIEAVHFWSLWMVSNAAYRRITSHQCLSLDMVQWPWPGFSVWLAGLLASFPDPVHWIKFFNLVNVNFSKIYILQKKRCRFYICLLKIFSCVVLKISIKDYLIGLSAELCILIRDLL